MNTTGAFRAAALEARKNSRPLIAVHRGTSAGIVRQNTVASARACLLSGGNIVEADVVRSSDGEYYAFHDGYEPLLLCETRNLGELTSGEIDRLEYTPFHGQGCGNVERFFAFVAQISEVFVNVDRSARYWPQGFLDELATHADPQYMLLKGWYDEAELAPLRASKHPYPFLGIVDTVEDIEKFKRLEDINLEGFEILYRAENTAPFTADYIRELRAEGYLIWLNAINLESGRELSGKLSDRGALAGDPGANWGGLVELGADVIQTDWPWLLRDYLEGRS